MHIPKYIARSGAALIVILILGIGALLWAALPDQVPAAPIAPPTPTAAPSPTPTPPPDDLNGGVTAASVCAKCEHVCHECHHSPHIIARGFYCQECAACITGCSSVSPPMLGGSNPCADLDDLGARLNELDCGQDPTTQAVLSELAGSLGCQTDTNSP